MALDSIKDDPKVNHKDKYEAELADWIQLEKAAIALIHVAGALWFDKSVELVLFRNQLVDRSASEILNLHQYSKEVVKKPINVLDTLHLAKEMNKLELAPSRIDIGRLTAEWLAERKNYKTATDFISDKLNKFIGKEKRVMIPRDVVLYGFGRIGRLLMRELITQAGKGEQLRLRAVVTRNNSDEDITKRGDLLRNDSVHGSFPGTVIEDFENKALIVNGHTVHMIAASDPSAIDYSAYGIHDALIIDNTGVVRDREGLSKHLKSKGVSKVLLTAPGKGDVPNIVYGVNEGNFDHHKETVFSAASCTTNAIVPVLAVIEKTLGIERGHIETIHSYTNDQNLLDNFHPKYRRGRSAALNMVITETGADKAVAKVLPPLAGKLTGNAVRVPTPDVSLAILNLTVKKETSKDGVNEILRDAALSGELVEQIQYSISNELVSTDLVGNPCASIVDSPATIVSKDNKSMVLYVWYDNEYGYSRQVIRYAKYLADVIRLRYY
ncbi:MAG: glyceraldehyde-3-phosphate dehydrogenase [Bacteroidetes bacterium]|jgi:glyceraldehyde 3-phosphate dehydrogenase|nr:glyceraldehyde-3-phosphate dehydrogenase [Bacteroidota bacterium]MBK9543009.1 glyceraldehyde-3-phosphate dehydrogenase [Bacteroidota bacterium]MBL0257289.1 glyceraldehyde-3-phosphate dehydrogenase [Bacteroidota bacterium]MBP6400942.1 glyceraldehyde-3-phosphate dehydrogenase [Bacteroidia bacterium]MBP6650516.1 glyceraldehyde-3-phosphate dehydrogenase [Bacteroidia bacterium]